jgi:Protein of unknown function (DUF669)
MSVTRSTILDEAFDTDTEEGSKWDLLPAGPYVAEIDDAFITPTKNGSGQMVSFKWKIVEGDYENRIVFDQVLIRHDSPEAERIGRQKFKDICDAVKLTGQVTDLDALKFIKASIRVGIEKDKNGQYADKNKVTRVQRYDMSNGSKPPVAKGSTSSDDAAF